MHDCKIFMRPLTTDSDSLELRLKPNMLLKHNLPVAFWVRIIKTFSNTFYDIILTGLCACTNHPQCMLPLSITLIMKILHKRMNTFLDGVFDNKSFGSISFMRVHSLNISYAQLEIISLSYYRTMNLFMPIRGHLLSIYFIKRI